VKFAVFSEIPVDRDRVFEALCDPAILRRSIPGCESMTPTGPHAPDTYDVALRIGIAGLKGSYNGRAAIREKQPPDSLTLGFEGKGAPGFVRGSAVIVLSDLNGGTRVACEADVQVGGVIATVGSRLIEAAAKKLAGDFFRQVSSELR
jgi:carbon monoxide dehydrogenase subunit G